MFNSELLFFAFIIIPCMVNCWKPIISPLTQTNIHSHIIDSKGDFSGGEEHSVTYHGNLFPSDVTIPKTISGPIFQNGKSTSIISSNVHDDYTSVVNMMQQDALSIKLTMKYIYYSTEFLQFR